MPNETGNVIDNLSLKIVSNSEQAVDNISGVITQLSTLSRILKDIKMPNLSMGLSKNTATNLENLANVIYKIDINRLKEFGVAAGGIHFKVGVSDKTSENLLALNTAIQSIDLKKFEDFGAVLGRIPKLNLGIYESTSLNLRSFATALNAFPIPQLAHLGAITSHFQPLQTGIQAATGDNIRSLASAVEAFPIPKLAEFGAINKFFTPLNLGIQANTGTNLASFGTALYQLPLELLREFAIISKQAGTFNLGISANTAKALAMFAEAITNIDIQKLRELASINFSNLEVLNNAAVSIRGLSNELKRLEALTTRAEAAQTKFATATRSVSRETRSSAHSFKLSHTMLGRLFSSIKRIAFYRMIRSALRAFTQGVSQGIENLYYWSQTVGSSFAPRMDQLATATTYLKNGFASMLSPLIERAIPILDAMIDRMVDFFNTVQELFASLTGQATWNKAIKYPVTYKDALDDAGKSAKALKNILMDFDEINAINTPTSGGSGSAKDAEDYSRMFELVETATTGKNPFGWLTPIFEDLRQKIGTALGTVKDFGSYVLGLNFEPLRRSLSGLWTTTLSPMLDELNKDAGWLSNKILKPLTKFLVEDAAPQAVETLSAAVTALWKAFEPLKEGAKQFWEENPWIADLFEDVTMQGLEKLQEGFEKFGKFFERNKGSIKSIFDSLSKMAQKSSPFLTAISKMLGTHAWDTFIDSIINFLYALEPLLTTIDGLLELMNEEGLGIAKIGQSIFQGLINPFKVVAGILATAIDALSHLVGLFDKDAAESMRNAAHNIRAVTDVLDEVNVGFSQWIEEMEETSDVTVIAAEKVRELEQTSSSAARESFWAWVEANDGIVDSWGNVVIGAKLKLGDKSTWAGIGNGAATELVDQFKSTLSPNTAFNIGKKFGSELGTSLGNSARASAQAALNMSPLQITATVRAQINGVNVNDKWRAALAAAGVPLSGFATGGFPTEGTVFMAGEGGVPELMGTIGGRTAVAGGMEITGIRDAIEDLRASDSALLRQLISSVNNKDLTLVANSSTGRWVNQAMRAYAGVTG